MRVKKKRRKEGWETRELSNINNSSPFRPHQTQYTHIFPESNHYSNLEFRKSKMSDQDWQTVTLSKSTKQKVQGAMQSNHAMAQAKASGIISSERKHGAAENKSAHAATGTNLKKLEESTDDFSHKTVNKNLSQSIVQARLAKKMTQAQLATAINERQQVIQQYESGQAIPNPQILNKLDRILGTHLPRK